MQLVKRFFSSFHLLLGLVKAGCRVPQDDSVTGFDNTRLAEYSNPSITTVDLDRDMLGKMAADALHEHSCSADPQRQTPAELILGDSSGLAPLRIVSLLFGTVSTGC